MAMSPNNDTNGVVRHSILSGGNAVGLAFQLISFTIRREVNRIGKALLVFEAGDMPGANIPESEDDAFLPGKEISVAAGYGDQEDVLFEGLVISHQVAIDGQDCTLQVECREYAFQTTQNKRNHVFLNKKDSEAINEIVGTYSNLTATATATDTTHNELVQYYCSDWDFIRSRADANGLVVICDGKAVRVEKPKVAGESTLKVTYGTDLWEFSGELSAAEQQGHITVQGWDPATQQIVEAQSSSPTLNDQGDFLQNQLSNAVSNAEYAIQTPGADKSLLETWANARQLRAGLARIKGSCKFSGHANAEPGMLLELAGLGSRFNGQAYVGGIEHVLDEEGWHTTAILGLSAENITETPQATALPASGLVPGIHGLHVGVVSKLDSDPAGEYRIEVEMPLFNSDSQKLWARLSHAWASNTYGSFHIPDIGDEVVLGFFNGDPNHAVVLGSLYSSKQKPAYELTAENNMRSIKSKSGIVIELEEQDKVVRVTTPAGNSIEMSDHDKSIKITDANNNKVELANSGILIESAAAIVMKAKTEITIEAGTALAANAKTTLAMKATNIEAKADAALTVKGNAKAEISATGQTVVRGAMVMIN